MRAAHRAVFLFLVLLCSGSCAPAPAVAPMAGHDLILINIDALRADHLGCYGYARDTSPFLDRLCREGVVFERASSASSYTRESVAALFTGRLPSKSGAIGWHAAPLAPHPTLAERLKSKGFRTAFLSNTVMLRKPGFESGFETVAHLSRHWKTSGEGARLSDAALRFVRQTAPERYFLYLHYLDPHAPYAPAEALRRRFREDSDSVSVALYDDVTPNLSSLRASGFGPGEARFEDLMARYDAEISATDAAIARLFEGLEKLGRLERTLVVITSDHGEEFLEHGWVDHGWTLYEESLHVPLIFWAPDVLHPARVHARASQVDLVPTLLELLTASPGMGLLDGEPIFETHADGARPRRVERAQIAELLQAKRQIVRAVLLDDWKYVAIWQGVHPRERSGKPRRSASDAIELWGPPVREEIFDLAKDPGERINALEAQERVREMLAGELEKFRDSGPNYGFADIEKSGERPVSGAAAERLRSLGYAE